MTAPNDRCGAWEESGCASDLGILMSKKTGLPAAFRIVPCGISDAVTLGNLLMLTDRPFPNLAGNKVFAAVMEHDRWSLANLRRVLEAGQRVIFTATFDEPWIREALPEALPRLLLSEARLNGGKDWGVTIRRPIDLGDGKERDVWVHVFRDPIRVHAEQSAFFAHLGAI